MWSIIKKVSLGAIALSISFLLVQVLCSLYLPTLTAGIVNKGIIQGDIAYIWHQGFVMLAFSVIGFAGAMLNTYISARVAYRLGSILRKEIYFKVAQFSNDDFNRIGTSSLITRNTNDVTQVQNLMELGLKFLILAPLYLIGGILMAYHLSPELAKFFLLIVPFITLICVGISWYANPLYSIIQKKVDSLNRIFREGLNGVKVIRAFSKEQWEYEKYQDVNKEYMRHSIKVNAVTSLLIPLTTLFINITTIGITWFGGKSNIEIGTIMGVVAYATQIAIGFTMLTNIIASIPRGQTSARRINEVLHMPPSITYPQQSEHTQQQQQHNTPSLIFADVSYRYTGAEKNTLSNVSFAVQAGQTLALIGSTGAGKSTLVNLIARLYDTTGGAVFINNTNVQQIPQAELYAKISIAPQKSSLFHDTVRNNMLLGNPAATDAAIWNVLDIAAATNFITPAHNKKNTHNGLDSMVEKSGGNFSGGQKQRLCIARALLKPADIYIFDDSFSALDFKTDMQVRSAMKPLLQRAITIIVAQRINTVMEADQILVLNEGAMVGLGTHKELAASNTVYQEIIQSQFERGVVL